MTSTTQFGDYMRRRPFLLIHETVRPAPDVRTEVKGWMEESGNAQVLERVTIVDRVQDKHLLQASVIIDLLNDKLVKNRGREYGEDSFFLEHYKEKYASQISEAMSIWQKNIDLATAKKATA